MKTSEAKVMNELHRVGYTFEGAIEALPELMTLRRLANKHRKLAEMDCNGVGVVRGVCYYNGTIDNYARREYGPFVQSAYTSDDVTVFDVESDKVQAKIEAICARLGLRVEFQGDPRGYTVKVFKGDRFLDIQG
jgi:hypothetical protein